MQADNGDMAHLDNFAILQGSFTAEDPTITFYHSMAFFKITLTLPDGEAMPDLSEGGYAEITLDVPTAQYLYMDLGTGEWIEDDDPWSKGILKVNVQGIDPEDTEVVGYMAVFPSDVSGRDIALKMEFVDGMGGSVAYTKTIAAKATRLIESGHYYTVTAQMEIPSVGNLDGGSITPLTPEEF